MRQPRRRRWAAELGVATLALVVCLTAGAAPAALGAETEAAAATGWRVRPVPETAVAAAIDRILPSVVGVVARVPAAFPGAPPTTGVGSGVVYRRDHVVTNHHVVADAAEVTLLLPDGTLRQASPANIWSDPVADLALIYVRDLPLDPAQLAAEQPQVGEPVLAVGYPLGLRYKDSTTLGVVSGYGRSLADAIPWLQTDAPINPGNSGGPLVNLRGEVLGINTWGYRGLGIEGLAFAIPAATVARVAAQLIDRHRVSYPWLGVDLAESPAAQLGLPEAAAPSGQAGVGLTGGLRITDVYRSGPLGQHALPGDGLLALGGQPVHTLDDYFTALATRQAGDEMSVTLRRGERRWEVTVSLGELPAEPGDTVGTNGIWRHLTPRQTWLAWALATYFRRTPESDLVQPYLRTDSSGRQALLLTEWFHIALTVLHHLKSGGEASPEYADILAGLVRGRLTVVVRLPAGASAAGAAGTGPLTATLRQGTRRWDALGDGIGTDPAGAPVTAAALAAMVPFRRDGALRRGGAGLGSELVLYAFPSTELDPLGEVQLVLTGPPGSGVRYVFEWSLRDLA